MQIFVTFIFHVERFKILEEELKLFELKHQNWPVNGSHH